MIFTNATTTFHSNTIIDDTLFSKHAKPQSGNCMCAQYSQNAAPFRKLLKLVQFFFTLAAHGFESPRYSGTTLNIHDGWRRRKTIMAKLVVTASPPQIALNPHNMIVNHKFYSRVKFCATKQRAGTHHWSCSLFCTVKMDYRNLQRHTSQ